MRDDTQNGCVADQENADSGIYSIFGYTADRVVVKVNSPEKEKNNKTLRSVHFGVVVVYLINCKCGGIVRNQIW